MTTIKIHLVDAGVALKLDGDLFELGEKLPDIFRAMIGYVVSELPDDLKEPFLDLLPVLLADVNKTDYNKIDSVTLSALDFGAIPESEAN